MTPQTKKIGNITEIYLNGRLDVQTSVLIETEIQRLIQSEPDNHILLNLAEVKYMSSSGIRIFVSTMRTLKAKGTMLKLCNLSDSVKKIFEVVELLDMFDVYITEEDAINSFQSV